MQTFDAEDPRMG